MEYPAIGQIVAERTLALTRDDLVRYAGASADFNPIHYREDVALSVGLPGVIAHGMLTMGVALAPVLDWLGDPGAVCDYQVKFTRPVVVPAQGEALVRTVATVGAIDEALGRVRVDLKVTFEETTVLTKAQVWVRR